MPLDQAAVQTALTDFFETVADAIAQQALDEALPILGRADALPGADAFIEALAAGFADLQNKVLAAIAALDPDAPDYAGLAAAAITAAAIPGVSANADGKGGLELGFKRTEQATTGDGTVRIGDDPDDPTDDAGPLSFLSIQTKAGATLSATVDALLVIDAAGESSLADQAAPEVTVAVTADLSIAALKAKLGVVDVELADFDPDAPEVDVAFGIDLDKAADGAFEIDADLIKAKAGLDLRFSATDVAGGVLPDLAGRLLIDFPIDGDGFGAPGVSVKEVMVDLPSYLDIVGDTASKVGELFNAGALGTIVDIAVAPVPVINDIAQAIPGLMNQFDKVGGLGGGGDGRVQLGDLAVGMQPDLKQFVGPFYQVLAIVDVLRKLGTLSTLGSIDIGGGSRAADGTLVPDNNGAAILQALKDKLASISDDILPPEVKAFLTDFDDGDAADALDAFAAASAPTPAAGFSVGPSKGFTFGLLENPADILKLLLTKETVNLVEFDLPELRLGAEFVKFFPILGPLGVELGGDVRAKIDVNVGYDSRGIVTGTLTDGFYFNTPADPTPLKPELTFAPAGELGTSLFGGAGASFGFGSVTVRASLDFGLYAYFDDKDGDGKFRPGADGLGCIFSPIEGTAGVSVYLNFKIGFGPFSAKKRVNLAEAKLADFNVFKCPPPTVEPTPEAPGLATVDGLETKLNVGDRAPLRKVPDRDTGTPTNVGNVDNPDTPENEAENEGYVVALARNVTDDGLSGSTSVPVDGKLDIVAFGVTQRVDASGVITAAFGAGADRLDVQAEVAVRVEASAGDGEDFLSGGALGDVLNGDGGEDILRGNGGADSLSGGADDDELSGGAGADTLDGGEGFDTVDYSRANRDVKVGVTLYMNVGQFAGSGGEADGDVLRDIENVVGTDFDDWIDARKVGFNTYLEGGAGDDFLFGGAGQDFLQGSAGADLLDGGAAEDATTYVFSWAGVDIDMLRAVQFGGDAQGDRLRNLEVVQSTLFDDTLRGDGGNNKFDAGSGDDVLDGRGGVDEIFAGDGDDLVLARGDGDLLDGGFGRDRLSYANAGAGVQVNLGRSQNFDGSFIDGPDRIVMAFGVLNGQAGVSSFSDLTGSRFADVLTGDVVNNRIDGGAGDDLVFGGAGFDTVQGGDGADLLQGGTGIDWADYSDSGAGVAVDLAANTAAGGTAEGDRFRTIFSAVDVENILGSGYADTLTGSDADNVIDPNIAGRAVTETVTGGAGVDTLRVDYSTAQADVGRGVVGGFIPDSADYLLHATASGDAVLDRVDFSGMERLDLVGTRFADLIYGGDGADDIATGDGNDLVLSGGGADVVLAQRGNDAVAYGFDLEIPPPPPPPIGAPPREAAVSVESPFVIAPTFRLNGGSGIDALSVDFSKVDEDVVITGGDGSGEFNFVNTRLAAGGSARQFEWLFTVLTGDGDDRVTQVARFNNFFSTGDGNDRIASGLGRDGVDGGLNTAGLTFLFTGEDDANTPSYRFSAPLEFEASGDALTLDYSSLGADQRVVSATASRLSLYVESSRGFNEVDTNIGRYSVLDVDTFGRTGVPRLLPDDLPDDMVFDNIERLDVTGGAGDDLLVGTDNAFDSQILPVTPQGGAAGDDVLRGGGGEDALFGKTGDDTLDGGDGDDLLQGASLDDPRSNRSYEFAEVDRLTGGAGADTFVLGVGEGVLYARRNDDATFNGTRDRGVITDFDAAEGDRIQLWSRAELYRLEETRGGTSIYLANGRSFTGAPDPSRDELIGVVQGAFGLDLRGPAFIYAQADAARPAEAGDLLAGFAAPAAPVDLRPPAPGDAPAALFSALDVQPLADAFTVAQESDAGAWKALFDAGTGATATSLSLSGNAQAFGTFAGDPFGLGKGVILSTGVAEDLPGPNTAESGGSNLTSIPITFTKLPGRTGDNDIYVADLSGLDIDIRSIKLRDSGSGTGGAGGIATAFDLGAIALSTTKLTNVQDLNLDDPAVLTKIDVFDFSTAGVTFLAGDQREPSGPDDFQYGPDLNNSVNELVREDLVRLGLFTAPANNRGVSLGNDGSIGFDLTAPVRPDGPLYLYLAEVGGSGETIVGALEISGDTIEPTGDLSTDLGAPGLAGDATSMTYRFTPKAGDTAFAMKVVLFTEELPEFDGTKLTDLFSVKLNGVEIGALNNGNALSIKALALSANADVVFNEAGTGPLADVVRADAYTRVLNISGDLVAGENVLTIEARDGRDAFLDSGLLIQTDSLRTFVRPRFAIDLGDGAAEPGGTVGVTISLPPDADLTGPVVVTLTPGQDLDLGGGFGGSVTVTFDPDGPAEQTVTGTVSPDADPDQDTGVTFEVSGDDPDLDGVIPPVVIDVLPPTAPTDPYLIFERLSGDLVEGFTAGNDVIDASGLPGPSSFHVEGLTTGKDRITGFGRTDILIVDERIFDANGDGLITFGKNGVLDLDGPDKGVDTLRFAGGPSRLRAIGADDEGHWVYADAAVRLKGMKEGRLGDDVLAGDAAGKARDAFLFDTNLDVNWGTDRIDRFGKNDFLVTTSRLYDGDGDGLIALDDGRVGLNGNPFFDPAHAGPVGTDSPFGSVSLRDTGGVAVAALALDQTQTIGGVTYYYYRSAAAPAAMAAASVLGSEAMWTETMWTDMGLG